MLQQKHIKKGFTIIEVVLVLAIAGLIFLMVFLALPALQRAQRDTQRKEDISRFMTAVTHYEANNRGDIPNFGDTTLNPTDDSGCTVDPDNGAPLQPDSFCGRYLIVQGANDQFADPDGTPYVIRDANDKPEVSAASNFPTAAEGLKDDHLQFVTVDGKTEGGITIKNVCDGIDCNTSGNGVSSTNHGGYSAYQYIIHVIYSATCNGEIALPSSGARKFAVLYKLEGGGVMCQSN
jgi:prepilin-type N-terminal cleavage/methylation domain-containing protein